MSSSAQDIQGHVVIVAHIVAAPGKGDEVEKVIKAVRDSANSNAEPGTLVYRVSRYKEEFAHFEEYESAEAIKAHMSLEPFSKLVEARKAGIIAKLDYAHYKEL